VVDAMDLQPGIFEALADEDEGHDPNKLETELLRDRFDRHEIYLSLAAEVEEVASVFSDTALAGGALVKPVALARNVSTSLRQWLGKFYVAFELAAR
jgi:hypothetical protein